MTEETLDYRELGRLIDLLLEGALSAAETDRLNAVLLASPDARRFYAEAIIVHEALAWHTQGGDADMGDLPFLVPTEAQDLLADLARIEDETDTPLELVDITEEMKERAGRLKQAAVRDRLRLARWQSAQNRSAQPSSGVAPLVWISLAALIGLAVWLGWPKAPAPPTSASRPLPMPDMADPVERPRVATIHRGVGTRWSSSAAPHPDGLFADQPVALLEGYAQVVFSDGASVIVQAPATFVPTGGNGMRLESGRITATVPASAVGFTVATASGLITDLGTEFGVEVGRSGAARAQVFDGEVTLMPTDGATGWRADETIRLRAGDAVEAMPSGTLRGIPTIEDFVRQSEFGLRAAADAGDAGALQEVYRLDLVRRPDLLAFYDFEDDAAHPPLSNLSGSARGRFDAALPGAGRLHLAPGRHAGRQAIELRPGEPCPMVDDWSEAMPVGQMTITAWIQTRSAQPWHMIAGQWSDTRRSGPGYRLERNFHFGIAGPGNSFDTLGPRLTFHIMDADDRRRLVCDEDRAGTLTRPGGEWVFVALVIDAREQTATLYKDGRQIDVGRCVLPQGLLGTVPTPLAIGGKDGRIEFDGLIDEIAFFSTALSEREVQEMYTRGRP